MKNELLTIPEEHVFLEFRIKNQSYAVISKSMKLEEDDEVYFAKVEYLYDSKIIRNIETEKEYEEVLGEYQRILSQYEEVFYE